MKKEAESSTEATVLAVTTTQYQNAEDHILHAPGVKTSDFTFVGDMTITGCTIYA
jgi:hypothetical protein